MTVMRAAQMHPDEVVLALVPWAVQKIDGQALEFATVGSDLVDWKSNDFWWVCFPQTVPW